MNPHANIGLEILQIVSTCKDIVSTRSPFKMFVEVIMNCQTIHSKKPGHYCSNIIQFAYLELCLFANPKSQGAQDASLLTTRRGLAHRIM